MKEVENVEDCWDDFRFLYSTHNVEGVLKIGLFMLYVARQREFVALKVITAVLSMSGIDGFEKTSDLKF